MAKDNEDRDNSRRDFLKRVLRTGAYAAPVMVAMSMKNLHAAQASAAMMAPMMMP